MSEQLVAFAGPLGTLRGVLHRPDRPARPPVVMLLHGFTGHHIESGHLFSQAARHLAKAGFAALRFDFYGSGNSDGDFAEMTVFTEVADAAAALDWLSAHPDLDTTRAGVVGLSLGGCVTALLAGQDPRVRAAVFWNAVSLPRLHFADIPRTGPDVGVSGGLRVGQAFFETFDALNITGHLRRYDGPGLVVRGTGDDVVADEEAAALMAALDTRGTRHDITGADHTFNHPRWRSGLFDVTTRWLGTHLTSEMPQQTDQT